MPKDICSLGKETIAGIIIDKIFDRKSRKLCQAKPHHFTPLHIVMVNMVLVSCYTQPCHLTEVVVSAGCCSQFGSSESTSARYFSMASIFARSPSLFHASLHEDSPIVQVVNREYFLSTSTRVVHAGKPCSQAPLQNDKAGKEPREQHSLTSQTHFCNWVWLVRLGATLHVAA